MQTDVTPGIPVIKDDTERLKTDPNEVLFNDAEIDSDEDDDE